MKPVIKDNGKNIISTPLCGNCGEKLSYKHYRDERGVPCVDTNVIIQNYCSNCGEIVEGYKEDK